MDKSSSALGVILAQLTQRARDREFTDGAWAARAGIRKETLSRLRRRDSCDFGTLQALAEAVGMNIRISGDTPRHERELLPGPLDRLTEEALVDLCASGDLSLQRWRRAGPAFFMAGLAVMMASESEVDRRAFLELAEQLHEGSSRVEVFSYWLAHSPIRASRFMPIVRASGGAPAGK